LIDRGLAWPPHRVLVPFTGTAQDRAALRLAARVARRNGAALTVLGVVRPGETAPAVELPEGVPPMRVIASRSPIDTVIREAAAHDLTVLGVGAGWQLEPHVCGLRSERRAAECPAARCVA